MYVDAFREMYSPFISEKFLFGAALNLYRGRDDKGRELTPVQGLENLAKVFIPGTVKSGLRIWEAYEAEEKAKDDAQEAGQGWAGGVTRSV